VNPCARSVIRRASSTLRATAAVEETGEVGVTVVAGDAGDGGATRSA